MVAFKKKRPFAKLGARCKQLRIEARMSQMDVVKNHDFGLSHYQKIERGDLDPRFSTLRKLAKAYGVSMSTLLRDL